MAQVLAEFDFGEPPQELIEWAKENINENPDTRSKEIEEFRDLISSRGECTPHRTDDAFLLRFLRGRHFRQGASHQLLVNYYRFKEENPAFFKNVHVQHLLDLGDQDVISVPPYREQTGRRILLYRLGNWDPKKCSIDELFQASLLILEMAILEQRSQILGGVCIFDFANLSMSQAWYFTPSIASKLIQIIASHFPLKVPFIHIVNQSWVFEIVYNVIKPFLEERMKERIFFHGDNYASLHQHIDPKHLPVQYGGVHPHYNYNIWVANFRGEETIRKELASLGYQDLPTSE